MDKDLRDRISGNKVLTRDERTKIISDLESYEKLQTNIKKATEEMASIELIMSCEEMRDYCIEILKRNIGE